MRSWLTRRVGVVRLRQIVDEARHRLAFVPLAMTLVAVVASQVTLLIDRAIDDGDLPGPLVTTVDGGRAILATIAGGLITAFTLLVSMMLVAVQLASGQFSPRTLRNWLGDATLRRAIGLVMATSVYCLLALRSIRQVGEDAFTPHLTVIVAVLLGVASLVSVVRAVDHVTKNLQVGTVAQRITDETIGVIESVAGSFASEDPTVAPATARARRPTGAAGAVPESAIVVEADRSGWVQQIDAVALAEALPEGSTAWIDVVHGAYVLRGAPLLRVDLGADDDDPDELGGRIRSSFAIGESRTMQRDIGFGIAQLADIAVRALSPGVNDPQTAQDVIRHLGDVAVALWSFDEDPSVTVEAGRTIHRITTGHTEYLRAAFDPIRRYGRTDPAVMVAMARTIAEVRNEAVRRALPGPGAPLDEMLVEIAESADAATWLDRERDELLRVTAA